MAAALLTNTEIGVLCVAVFALGLVFGKIFANTRVSEASSISLRQQDLPTTPLQRRILHLLDGSTIAIEPSELAEVMDAMLERALENPTRKCVLRFEIWPAATTHWLVSALGPEATRETQRTH